jgi:hypothetical protein
LTGDALECGGSTLLSVEDDAEKKESGVEPLRSKVSWPVDAPRSPS